MKLVSIIGDSISTYEGYIPRGYDVFYDEEMQAENGLQISIAVNAARISS